MKVLVVYDSTYGNTEKVATAIASRITGDVKILRAASALDQLTGVDLLVVGAPTNGGRPTPAMLAFLDGIPAGGLNGVKVAAFDTRLTSRFAKIFGYAAPKIADALVAKGGRQVADPLGLLVAKSKGPLVDGEIERAAAWGKSLADNAPA